VPTDNDQIMSKLMSFHSEFTEFRGEMKARVNQIEKEQSDARTWENIKIFMVLPLSAGLHQLASKMGLFRG